MSAIYEICKDSPNFQREFSVNDVMEVLKDHQDLMREDCEYKSVDGVINEMIQAHAIFDMGSGNYMPNPERIAYASNFWWN